MLPRVELPELLLEVHAWTGFLHAYVHVSGHDTRMTDLPVSVAALLIAEACNVGLAPVTDPDVEALTRGRLSHVDQNYLRADTHTAANAVLVDATGKTTGIKQLGRVHELRTRARYPHSADRIPIVYVTCPPKGSPRKLAMEFARFLGLPPVGARQNVTDIADAVCRVLIDARTDLVIVDEIHNLNLATAAGEDLSDHLKYFTEHLPATFIYAGIDVERSGVFTGTRGRQLAGRCSLIPTGPFPYRDEWEQLVAALEATLRLHHHPPGTLVEQAKYLHHRTGGMIGSLAHLIRAAAIRAILTGAEQLTPQLMDTVRIDHAAESATRRASSTR